MKELDMSGLDRMQALTEVDLVIPQINATVFVLKHFALGNVGFEARVDEQHTDALGTVRFGFITTVLEAVTGYAAQSVLDKGQSQGLLDMNFKLYDPVPSNITMMVEGKIVHTKRRVILTEGFLRDANGALYAYATATHAIMRKD